MSGGPLTGVPKLGEHPIQLVVGRFDDIKDCGLQGEDAFPLKRIAGSLAVTFVLLVADRELTSGSQSFPVDRQDGSREGAKNDSYESEDGLRSHISALLAATPGPTLSRW